MEMMMRRDGGRKQKPKQTHVVLWQKKGGGGGGGNCSQLVQLVLGAKVGEHFREEARVSFTMLFL